MKKIIYYQTKTKFINTGDALINKALLDTLRNYGSIKCNCSNEIPDYFIKELGICEEEKISNNSELGFVLNILKNAVKAKRNNTGIYIFSGLGHNFGGSIKKCIRNIIASFLFMIYRLFGVKTIRIGMSIGPITKLLAITEKIRSKFVDYYYVRDTSSLELCHKIGIKKAKLAPDLSWLYEREHMQNFNNVELININLRDSIFDTDKNQEYQDKTISRCEDIIKVVSERYDVKLIFSYQVEEDKEFCLRAYNHFKSKYNCNYIENQLRLNDAKNIYSKCRYNISNRMHSLLLGYKYGSLPIAVIDTKKHTKIQQTFIDCNLEELSVDIYQDDTAVVSNIIENDINLFERLLMIEKNKQEELEQILLEILD